MLVLARQLNERIVMPTVQATIEVVAIRPSGVRLGIDAPAEVPILREEVLRRGGFPSPTLAPIPQDAETRLAQVRHALRNRLHTLALGLALLRQHLPTPGSPEQQAMLRRMEDEVRTLDQQLRALLYNPLDETLVPTEFLPSARIEAGSATCLDGVEGGMAI
jgi:carbon storage regulator